MTDGELNGGVSQAREWAWARCLSPARLHLGIEGREVTRLDGSRLYVELPLF